MGKVQSIVGRATGKVGSLVFSVTGGQGIVREYNPNVKNPNTVLQINQRSRLKLASQLAAALAPVIVIPREGLVTARNKFIKANMDFITSNNGQAMISYENIQLTAGVTGLPGVRASRDGEGKLNMLLDGDASKSVTRIVYIVYRKTEEDQLQFVDSAVISEPGENGTFPASIVDFDGDVIIWAYGIKDTNSSASAKYGNYSVSTGEDIAQLVMSRKLASGDYQFTKTRGTTLFDNEDETIHSGPNQNMVYITASGPGVVKGDGFTNNRKVVDEGQACTVHAVANDGCEFLGWRINGNSGYVSNAADYTFTPTASTDLVAIFNDPNSSTGGSAGFDTGE